MLIEFNVTNFRSFFEQQQLLLTANARKELREENTFPAPVAGVPDLVRSAAVYGPNAGGKSNLIRALAFMQFFVLHSASNQVGDSIDVSPFLFNQQGPERPCELEITCVQNGVRYQYGFAVTAQRVINEWLIAYPEGRPQRWFERTYLPETNAYDWYYGPRFRGHKKQWQDLTRENVLFLSAAVQWNSEQLTPIFLWFRDIALFRGTVPMRPTKSCDSCLDDSVFKKKILELMNEADFSILDIEVEKKEFSPEDMPKDLPPELREKLHQMISDKVRPQPSVIKMFRAALIHPGENNPVPLLLDEESEGTQKLFAYAGPLLDALKKGQIVLFDELESSLHPKIVRFILSLFHNTQTNPKNAQLIFSTHNTTLLDASIMRDDQVWFVEKNQQNASHLYPLSDFRTRSGEAWQKGYLSGRYGAVPFIKRQV